MRPRNDIVLGDLPSEIKFQEIKRDLNDDFEEFPEVK